MRRHTSIFAFLIFSKRHYTYGQAQQFPNDSLMKLATSDFLADKLVSCLPHDALLKVTRTGCFNALDLDLLSKLKRELMGANLIEIFGNWHRLPSPIGCISAQCCHDGRCTHEMQSSKVDSAKGPSNSLPMEFDGVFTNRK